MPLAVALSVALPLLFVSRAWAQTTVGRTCFAFDGDGYDNNTICPGSNSCCGYEATCLSNKLCHNPGDGPDVFVRGPCALETWDSTCPQICLYSMAPPLVQEDDNRPSQG